MRHLLCVISFAFLVAGASAQDVGYNFDETVDFSGYKTYRWVEHPQSQAVDDLTKRQLKAALDAELAKKGLTESPNAADLTIVFQIATRQELEITTWDRGWDYGPGWGRRWHGGGGFSTSTSNTITVGSLALDLYDSSTKNLVWRGVVSKTIDPKVKPDKRKKAMQKAVEKLLKNYPPKRT